MTTVESTKPETWIAIYAALVSTIALGWQIATKLREGTRLRVLVLSNRHRPGTDDNELYVDVEVVNTGNASTTVQVMFLQAYRGWFRTYQATVGDGLYGDETPCELAPGKTFRGAIAQDERLIHLSRTNRLYVGIKHTMSRRLTKQRIEPIY